MFEKKKQEPKYKSRPAYKILEEDSEISPRQVVEEKKEEKEGNVEPKKRERKQEPKYKSRPAYKILEEEKDSSIVSNTPTEAKKTTPSYSSFEEGLYQPASVQEFSTRIPEVKEENIQTPSHSEREEQTTKDQEATIPKTSPESIPQPSSETKLENPYESAKPGTNQSPEAPSQTEAPPQETESALASSTDQNETTPPQEPTPEEPTPEPQSPEQPPEEPSPETRIEQLQENLARIRRRVTELEIRLKRERSEEVRRLFQEALEEYTRARINYFKATVERDQLERAIKAEQQAYVEELERHLTPKQRFLRRFLNNRIVRAYLRIPRTYRWVGYATLGATALLASGASIAAAATYFGYKLARYTVGALTSAGAVKAAEAFEEYYGTNLSKQLGEQINQILDLQQQRDISIRDLDENTLQELIARSDQFLRKSIKIRKATNYAKMLAAIGGFFAGYEATDLAGGKIIEVLGIKSEALAKTVEAKAQTAQTVIQTKASYIEVAQKGDSIWKMTKRALAQKFGAQWNSLDEAQKTYLIDAIKDKIADSPEKFGLHTQNIDLIHPGDKIDFSSLLNNQEFVSKILDKAEHLSFQEKAHIVTKIDWEKTISLQGGATAKISSLELVGKGDIKDFGIQFVDFNHDGIPDQAWLISKGEIVEKITAKGKLENLEGISKFVTAVRHHAEDLSHTLPKPLLSEPEVLRRVLENHEVLDNLNSLAQVKGLNFEKAIAIYKTTGGHLELLKDIHNNWDASQIAVFSHLEGKPDQIQKALAFSKRIHEIPLDQKIAWAQLKINPNHYKEALRTIEPHINPEKIKEVHWDGDSLMVKVNRKFWFDKTYKLSPFKKPAPSVPSAEPTPPNTPDMGATMGF